MQSKNHPTHLIILLFSFLYSNWHCVIAATIDKIPFPLVQREFEHAAAIQTNKMLPYQCYQSFASTCTAFIDIGNKPKHITV